MRNQELYLSDILEAIQNISDFVGITTFDEFMADRKTQSAVIHQFQIVGEAIKHIAPRSGNNIRKLAGKIFQECGTF